MKRKESLSSESSESEGSVLEMHQRKASSDVEENKTSLKQTKPNSSLKRGQHFVKMLSLKKAHKLRDDEVLQMIT